MNACTISPMQFETPPRACRRESVMKSVTQILFVYLSLIVGLVCLTGGQCVSGTGMMGPPGMDGMDGTDGSLRVYGDGSAGDKVVSSDENWNDDATAPTNLQFASLTIEDGVTLTVPSGMTIRVTGDVTNYGTLLVRTSADGGFAGLDGPGTSGDLSTQITAPDSGIGTRAAQAGELSDNTVFALAGQGGEGISEFESRQLLTVGVVAGGGGAVGGDDTDGSTTSNVGSAGGGGVRILAMGTITNATGAAMMADGGAGAGGGGGGGHIVLASMTAIVNDGDIMARGGDGESSDSNEGPSGGGGGGIVHMLAPMVMNDGTVDVSGGSAGGTSTDVTSGTRQAGGGGGASGGDGGRGGNVPNGGSVTPEAAGDGQDGFGLVTELDPTSLL